MDDGSPLDSPLDIEVLGGSRDRSGRCNGDGWWGGNNPFPSRDLIVARSVAAPLSLDSFSIDFLFLFHSMWASAPGFWDRPKCFFSQFASACWLSSFHLLLFVLGIFRRWPPSNPPYPYGRIGLHLLCRRLLCRRGVCERWGAVHID